MHFGAAGPSWWDALHAKFAAKRVNHTRLVINLSSR